MRVLVAGSRDFRAGYRIDRALSRVSKGQSYRDMVLVTIGVGRSQSRTRNGADMDAKELAEAMSWRTEKVKSVSEARADVCLAFLHTQDPYDDLGRITALKAEKAGIPVWRYYEGEQRPVSVVPDLETWEDDLLAPFEPPMTFPFTIGGVEFRIVMEAS